MQTNSLIALVALAALAIAGCGGPDPATDGSATDPTAAEDADAAVPELQETPPANPSAAAPLDGDDTAPTVASGRFQLDTHYRRLSPTQPTSSGPAEVEVAEVFWYGCPHCFTFDPYLARWLPSKAENVSFVRIPAVWNPLVRLHARAFYTAEALGKGEETHDAFFREIHVNRNALDTEAKLEAFFAQFGVEPAAFKTAFDSFAVHSKLQRADELARRYQISSVPTIVINGKYTSDGGMAGGYDELIELIDELTAAERAAN
jgi:protein dithiol oxidoreductase (disulfide-forming)